ncbi:MAG: ParB/RepB/Spo0J family partition protein [Betaproteobacteria bacterium]|jgi:ParB family transcriptional regulator, chromosome partitioning protein|nr:ParB/RepB/Spo0J family partition protein [Betaproteobacteria bacterium]NBP43764.1 ParB/RepB/Spo0J family partition protein [Betaproteobacteria bacterium]
MATKKTKGLGRGLEALLGPDVSAASDAGSPSELSLDVLVPGEYQPRTRMDEGALYELAESIRAQGVMQPLLVRPLKNKPGTYEIIAGERRSRAARLAGLTQVPVLIKEVSDQNAAAMALIENMQREDLNPLEEAKGLQRLVNEFKLTHDQAAQAVGRSRSAASNLLRLLQLTSAVQDLVMAGDLDMGHARALLALQEAEQISAAQTIVAKKLSVREAEQLVKQWGQSPKASTSTDKSGDVRRVEEELSDLLTARVEVRAKGKGARLKGELAIAFSSLDELNGLIERLKKTA